jgi:hypothetical protein
MTCCSLRKIHLALRDVSDGRAGHVGGRAGFTLLEDGLASLTAAGRVDKYHLNTYLASLPKKDYLPCVLRFSISLLMAGG